MKKRLFAILLTVFMIASLLPTGAFAAEAVTYIERRWDDDQGEVVEERKEVTDYTLISPNNRINFTVHDGRAETTLEAGWYVVEGNNYYNYINNNEDIRLELYIDGDVKIILKDGALLSVGCVAGWDITNLSDTLTIYGQEFDTGRLETNPSDASLVHSGIGGRMASVTIHGGDIKAQSADGGAGIGGTDVEGSDDPTFVHGCDVTIFGGNVDASGSYGKDDRSGYGGAGIGGGGNDPDDIDDGSLYNEVSGNGGNVTIYGGTVTAKGGGRAAGIGGGYATDEQLQVNKGGNGGTVNIYGGHVTAIGGEDIAEHGYYGGGAGIGGSLYGNGGTVNIYGGTVSATGGKGAAGIGGGQGAKIKDYTIQYGNSGTITISGGTVIAQGGDAINSAGGGGAGIGGGAGGVGGEINITGGIVQATGGDNSAGIGNQAYYALWATTPVDSSYIIGGTGGTVNISGGAVTATGGYCGTGIGNAWFGGGRGGTVNISGGTVTAGTADSYYGNKQGSGIGNPEGTVTISGGTVTAEGSNSSEANSKSVLGAVNIAPAENISISVKTGLTEADATEIQGSPFQSGTSNTITIASDDLYFHSESSENPTESYKIYIAGKGYGDAARLELIDGQLQEAGNIPDIHWTSSTNTLTVYFSVDLPEGTHKGAAIYCPGDLNIVLQGVGTSEVTGKPSAASSNAGYGIYVGGDLTISGRGTLNATGTTESMTGGWIGAYGIYAEGDIAISGGTVNAVGNASDTSIFGSFGISSGSGVTISGGTVNAKGGSATFSYGVSVGAGSSLNITGGEVTAEGENEAVSQGISNTAATAYVSPAGGRQIAVETGENAASAAQIEGSPFSSSREITTSIANQEYFHSYEVIPATGLTVTPKTLSLGVGGVDVLTAKVTPSNASAPNVTWTSSDDTVVTVEQNGKITALKAGTATITASYGSLSATCVVTVTETAAISQHPADVSVPVGESASFSVSATVTATAYQWQTMNDKNEWENITGATGDRYTIAGATVDQNGSQYRCVVTAGGGEELKSNSATLTVYEKTEITEQPKDASAIEGRAARFSVTASGTGLEYQWQVKSGTDWENITGATDSSYTVLAAELGMTGSQYRCVVSGADGKTVESNAAKLTVSDTGYFISVAVYGEGTASASKTTANAGERITLTAKPAGGYHFESWVVVYGGVEIDEEDDSFIMPESGVTILAVFARNYTGSGDITLTFKTRGGTELEEMTVARGSTVDLRGYMSWREGYDFAGWYSDGSFMERLDEIKMDGSRTVYAGWEPFDDVGWADWFHDNVVYVYENGLMNGTGAAVFEPDGTVTRGMIVTILHRLEGEPAVNYLMPFADVAEGAWYAEAVRWAASEGIVTGVSETAFAPNDPITREQFAAILWRYAKYKGFDVSIGESTNILSYTDFGEIGEYAIPALQWACGEGIISGRGEGVLDPRGTATRAEAAAMLQRFAANVK